MQITPLLRRVMSSVTCLALPPFSTLSKNGTIFAKIFFEQKII
jgi:hypothetical protein